MRLRCLAVDSNLNIATSYVTEWVRRGIVMDRVDNMSEAIWKLLENNNYIFVGINGDATDYLHSLKEMCNATDIPIMIVTSNFTSKAEQEALRNGADLYARWHDTPEDNVSSVLAHIDRLTDERKATRKFMFCRNLLVSLKYRSVHVYDKKVALTRQEYDLLCYMMANRGEPLSYGQIYRQVWGRDHEDIPKKLITNLVSQLREHLHVTPHTPKYIETVRDFGYQFMLDDDK